MVNEFQPFWKPPTNLGIGVVSSLVGPELGEVSASPVLDDMLKTGWFSSPFQSCGVASGRPGGRSGVCRHLLGPGRAQPVGVPRAVIEASLAPGRPWPCPAEEGKREGQRPVGNLGTDPVPPPPPCCLQALQVLSWRGGGCSGRQRWPSQVLSPRLCSILTLLPLVLHQPFSVFAPRPCALPAVSLPLTESWQLLAPTAAAPHGSLFSGTPHPAPSTQSCAWPWWVSRPPAWPRWSRTRLTALSSAVGGAAAEYLPKQERGSPVQPTCLLTS